MFAFATSTWWTESEMCKTPTNLDVVVEIIGREDVDGKG